MEHSRHENPLSIYMDPRCELSISINAINFKDILAFSIPSPYKASMLLNRFGLQAYPGVSFQTSDEPFSGFFLSLVKIRNI